ncbi:MAG: prepilin-type N-terminal cleavage/methylation domain-containing protein [Patescibacteria group bacterium]|mgnify:FL=1
MKGFTLIEIIVALGLISLVSVSVMSAVSLSLTSAAKIKNDLIAAGLAQEGLEIVRNIRDKDWHLGSGFGASLTSGNYLVDWNSQSLLSFSDTFLKKDSNGLYNYLSGQDTIFKRKIIIENSVQNPASVEKVAKVEISWQEKSGSRIIQAEVRLFNWR